MESRVEIAVNKHKSGQNCAQAVVCTYCDKFGVDEQTAYLMSEAFGFGMGSQSTCGALTGALMVLGLAKSGGLEKLGKTKGATYGVAREMIAEFKEKAGAVLCSDIKSTPPTCSCSNCVKHGAQIVEDFLID